MNTPQILTGQQAIDQFGLNALIECRVAVTTELNGLGHSVMQIGVIADPDSCQIDEGDNGVLWVEYQGVDDWYLYSIPADEQFVLLDGKNPPTANDVLARRVVELSNERDAALASSLTKHLERQIAFSINAFGPNKRTAGIIDHMKKELVEVEAAPEDITEWIDLVMLALDGAWRHVDRANMTNTLVAQLVQKTLTEKLAKNEARSWPDWRLLSEDKAIEHDRSNTPAG